MRAAPASLLILLVCALPASAQTWFLPDVYPNHHLAATHKLEGHETIGSGRIVYWLPTLESDYWSTGRWSRSLTDGDQRPCCWDLQQWLGDGDRGRGGYSSAPDSDVYELWSGQQTVPTFPIVVDEASLPQAWVVPAGSATIARVHRPSDELIGYVDAEGVCCAPAPVPIHGRAVLVQLSALWGGLKLEGWGVDDQGRRTTGGEAFYFCRGCLTGPGGAPTDGPLRWELTSIDGRILQQWTFARWVPRTAQDVTDTMRPELDRLRRQVRELREQLAESRP